MDTENIFEQIADPGTEVAAAGTDTTEELVLSGEVAPAEEAPVEPSADERLAQYQQQLQAEQEYRARLEQEREQYAAELQRRQYEDEQRRMAAEEEQAFTYANTLPYDEAMTFLRQWHQQRVSGVLQAAQQTTARATVAAYRQDVIKQFNIAPEDVELLGNDPYQMEAKARALAARDNRLRSEMESIKKELQQVKRGQRAADRLGTGIDKNGAATGRPGPRDYDAMQPSDILRDLLGSAGMLPS